MASDLNFTPTLLAALFTFSLVASITPGPNNIMLMVSGVNFGVRRTVPQMAGVFTGLALINIAMGLGLGFVFSHFPVVRIVLMALGVAYMLWLAWKIATAGSLGGGVLAHPLSFTASLAFQWVNPKLWAMAITAAVIYVRPAHMLADTALVTGVFSVVNVPCMLVWVAFGTGLRDALQVPARIQAFNILMALLLVASALAFLRI